ncbi:phosphomethylpyrimidine kinase [Gordoniibacillus kamchatkensis]|uniref:Hydroxymethylpyrimidine/phosphomethylpyrimidine kinase n=1 Tax=Gordoniibacillus kamchatkensis TaxID=1590651 RepID=A0ABR5AMJ4_9BACL|nr:bifunctional hydroxymethylpyrimidine kinase/phosphomethylpyrimidine kinase [Paenibacillus sp. VKM B-2647]KIL42253.1 phosphomethylpyrimidine kinase [Paenibacillus sp. VKM B-2647]
MTIARALTIAGSDSGGGAGIQADLKTFQELRVFGMSAITAITAQNTLGVLGIYPLPVDAVLQQIDAIGADLGTDAVKTGMLFSADIIAGVAERLRRYGWSRVVVDPVMIAKGGAKLLQDDAVRAMKEKLLPQALVLTPNMPEAEALAGVPVRTLEERKEAARRLAAYGVKHVVMKGGHEEGSDVVVDLLYDGSGFTEFASPRVYTRHTHGTGCTFAAAVAAGLAKGQGVAEAVATAKQFIGAAIEDSLELGQGHGPTNHWAYRERLAAAAMPKEGR